MRQLTVISAENYVLPYKVAGPLGFQSAMDAVPAPAKAKKPLPPKHVYDSWKSQLASGTSARSGKKLTAKDIAYLQNQIADYDKREAAGETPRAANTPPRRTKSTTPATGAPAPAPTATPADPTGGGTASPSSAAPADPLAATPAEVPDPAGAARVAPPDLSTDTAGEAATAVGEAAGIEPTTPPPAAEAPAEAPAATTTPPSPVGTSMNLKQSIQAIKQAVDVFNQTFKGQHQLTEPAIRQVYNALNSMSQVSPDFPLTPEVNSGIQDLIQTLQTAASDEQQDSQFMHQIGQKAQSLADTLRLDPAARTNFQRGQKKPTSTTPAPAPAGAPSAPPASSANRGWGSGPGGFLGNIRNIPQNFMRGYNKARGSTANSRLYVKSAESYL